ncbi:MAG: hypothetical protein ACQESH_02465 [Campylobacterota bacterium]
MITVKGSLFIFASVAITFIVMLLAPLYSAKGATLSLDAPLHLSISIDETKRIYPELQKASSMDFVW